MTDTRSSSGTEEAAFLEDNIATVAHHLGQPGARMSVSYEGGSKLIVDPGEVLKEISRRLGVAQSVPEPFDVMATIDPAYEPGMREALLLAEDTLKAVQRAYSCPDSPIINLTLQTITGALSPVPSTSQKSPVMQAAENAAKVVEGWSDSKKAYADRVTGTKVTSTDRP